MTRISKGKNFNGLIRIQMHIGAREKSPSQAFWANLLTWSVMWTPLYHYCRCVRSEKSMIFMNFYSVEIIYYGAGSVIIWLRRFNGKSKNDIVQVLKQTLFDLSSYEVLEIYPYPELVQNDWFISTLRIFNNFMLG